MNKEELQALRTDYSRHSLSEEEVHEEPIEQFRRWLTEAVKAEVDEPNAMTLSTVDANNRPKSRIVLIKGIEEHGIVFYTNYESDKGREIAEHPHVSVCFFWTELERQVRIEGTAGKISRDESKAYFESRPYMSQIGAWTSRQSEVIKGREVLEERFEKLQECYSEGEVPLPDYWGGYFIDPDRFEFWQGRPSRLHDRICYEKDGNRWSISRLSP